MNILFKKRIHSVLGMLTSCWYWRTNERVYLRLTCHKWVTQNYMVFILVGS